MAISSDISFIDFIKLMDCGLSPWQEKYVNLLMSNPTVDNSFLYSRCNSPQTEITFNSTVNWLSIDGIKEFDGFIVTPKYAQIYLIDEFQDWETTKKKRKSKGWRKHVRKIKGEKK